MHRVVLEDQTDFTGWRDAARALAIAGVPPEEVEWVVAGDETLFADAPAPPEAPAEAPRFSVPKSFVDRAAGAILFRDPDRFAFLYRLLWRIRREPGLIEVAVDPDVVRLEEMTKAVRRDLHKMKAYVRFREVQVPEHTGARPRPSAVERAMRDGDHFNVLEPWYVAWFEPSHYIVETVAPFFVRRFTGMRWAILTPDRSVTWDGEAATFGPGAQRSDAPDDDALEDLWRTYYASIFNPARLKLATMQGHMPKKYWKNLPEAELIAPLAAQARHRTHAMIEADAEPAPARVERVRAAAGHTTAALAERPAMTTTNQLPAIGDVDLKGVALAAKDCRACDLWKDATQTVFGEGPAHAKIVMVGEQPGDQEDIAGHPFVGPAGKLLDRALVEAGIDRKEVYVTNAVKHFSFVVRGKRRMHQTPKVTEIRACRPWLEAEFERLEPDLVIALGASAANSIFGRPTGVEKSRGQWFKQNLGGRETRVMVTVHPSYLLRLPDEESKATEYARFVLDLKAAAKQALR